MRSSISSSVHNLSVFFFLLVSPLAVSADAAILSSLWRETLGRSEHWLLRNKCCRSWQNGETSRNMFPYLAETQNVSALEQKQILLLDDAGNNGSRVAKLGNIEETCTRYGCFWKHVSLFRQAFNLSWSSFLFPLESTPLDFNSAMVCSHLKDLKGYAASDFPNFHFSTRLCFCSRLRYLWWAM